MGEVWCSTIARPVTPRRWPNTSPKARGSGRVRLLSVDEATLDDVLWAWYRRNTDLCGKSRGR